MRTRIPKDLHIFSNLQQVSLNCLQVLLLFSGFAGMTRRAVPAAHTLEDLLLEHMLWELIYVNLSQSATGPHIVEPKTCEWNIALEDSLRSSGVEAAEVDFHKLAHAGCEFGTDFVTRAVGL